MSWSVLAPIITAAVSLIVAVLAHLRASRAQREQTTIDRAALINEAYQDVLSELRSEVDRLQETLSEERGRYEERVNGLREKVRALEDELQEEREKRIRLEDKVSALETELARVEKRKGWYTDEEDNDGAT